MNSKILINAGVLLVLATMVNSANILVIAFWSTKSHKITYMPLVEELGKRGHNLTVVGPIKPMKELKNVKEIFTLDLEKILNKHDMNPITEREKGGVDFSKWTDMNYDVCNESYDLPQVTALLKEKFDLVIYQPIFNECLLGLIYRLQAPFVGFTPLAAPHWTLFKTGTYLPSSFNPNFVLSYPFEMNFVQRFLNFGMDRMIDLFNALQFVPMAEQLYREKLGQDIPSVQEILNNSSMTLSNSHFSVSGPRTYLPDVVDVGGIHSGPAKPIPKDLEDFIGRGKDGFILFSMGSVIKAHMMPEEKRKVILGVFSKLQQQVLWKWDEETMPGLPNNVKLSKWLPQQDLLGHKDIKMFITHCGGGSTEESIYHGVPLVGIPIWGDQVQNANQAKKHNFIVELEWNKLTEETLGGAIQEVLEDPKYRENAKRISMLFKDRPMDPLEQGIYWIEYIIRHKGAPHLRSAGRKLNVLQYHSYDVILAYLVIIGGSLYAIFSVLRFACRKVCCRSGKKSKRDVTRRKKNN